jgi:hypothetical protein
MVRVLFGIKPALPLANPRLEKVRYFVCFARDNGRPSQRIWDELIQMGYSEAQVEALAWLALEGAPR